MTIQSTIEAKLTEQFKPALLSVENESHGHNVAPNSETHFKVVMVCESFAGKRKVARHQAVYSVLQAELEAGVHALALHLYDTVEWQARGAAPDSPACMGGSKK